MSNIIIVKEAPVISFEGIEKIGLEIDAEIKELGIDKLVANEESLADIKALKASLNKKLDVFENQRKLAHDQINKAYKDFLPSYNENIKSKIEKVSNDLKASIDQVTKKINDKKIDGLREYFEVNNDLELIKFEDVGLKVVKSKSDKHYKDAIDNFCSGIRRDLETIDTLDNRDRVLAKYEKTFDLSTSISQANNEIKREKEIKEKAKVEEKPIAKVKEKIGNSEVIEKPEVFEVTFKAIGDINQLKALKSFLESQRIDFKEVD